jgi:hypothetical protein
LRSQATLATYAEPIIGALPVQAIDMALVLKVIEPIWTTKPETAGRLRGRLESILDWARVRGYREGENPARWRGHIDKALSARSKVREVKHHAALAYAELPKFLQTLREQEGLLRAFCSRLTRRFSVCIRRLVAKGRAGPPAIERTLSNCRTNRLSGDAKNRVARALIFHELRNRIIGMVTRENVFLLFSDANLPAPRPNRRLRHAGHREDQKTAPHFQNSQQN